LERIILCNFKDSFFFTFSDYAESLHSDTTGDEDVMSDVSDDITPKPGSGMANVMAKLLGKKASSKTGPILCKAKTERELQARKKGKTNDIFVVPIDGSETSVLVSTSPDLKTEDDKPDVKTLTHIEQQMKVWNYEFILYYFCRLILGTAVPTNIGKLEILSTDRLSAV